ncbi:MAG: sugar ABC transporter ATP-binding protein [Butyrivibrio sp.]|nr:sugar ABC transporter ATP-binding protein [Butyrivibrio sp.]
MDNDIILEMKHIDKRFKGVHALDDVSLTLRRGEIHALIGENGAGKSTLMKILIGMYSPDKGEIIFKDKPVKFESMMDTKRMGISMIFQEFNQVKHMMVMENIYLGREPKTKWGTVDFARMYNDSKKLLETLEVELDPKAMLRDLTVAQFQLVEIAKALSYDAEIIIMDEPTSALSRNEIQQLLKTIRKMQDQGKAVVFISHKLDEIYGVCQRATILRDGKFIHSGLVKDIPEKELIHMMVNRDIAEQFPKIPSERGEKILEVKNLTSKGAFENISFTLHRGEILGFAGLMGAGRTELMEGIMGLWVINSGEIYYKGEKTIFRRPSDAISNGIIMVPEDRKRKGLVLKLSIKDNLLMSALEKCKRGWLRKNLEKEAVEEYKEKLEIKMTSSKQICANLSGGNQQKVVVSKALFADPEIIILDEPTRGIDVKTKADIHRLISQLACEGKAIIMVSSEMPEVLGMSDRIIVMHEGILTGMLQDREDFDQNVIMQYAIGSPEGLQD